MIDKFEGKYGFLSNFHYSSIKLDGITYPTAEHAYQASKTLNQGERFIIRERSTPGLAKRYGQIIDLREDWEQVKLGIMEHILEVKFSDPELKQKLIDTVNHELVEGNFWGDIYWGVCKKVGENHLGKLLMKIRERLRSPKNL